MHPDLSGAVTNLVSVATLLVTVLIAGVFALPKNLLLIASGAMLFFFQIKVRNRAYQLASASFVTMIISLTPVFVSVWSWIFLKESLEGIQILGGILIVGSGLLANRLKI
mgnify:CR=1 FL=1